jgi:FkbM family methyltransferase
MNKLKYITANLGAFQHRVRVLGWHNALQSLFNKLFGSEELVPLLSRPGFYLRSTGSGSDFSVCHQVFADEEYAYKAPYAVTTIVDAGANIGCASVFFAEQFPARIIAVEPAPDNYQILCKNTGSFGRITCLNAALWDKSAQLSICERGEGAWALYMAEASGQSAGTRIEGITLREIRRRFDLNHIDILKVDIEGGERNVFAQCLGLLDGVNVLIIETHDRWEPGCTRVVYEATREFDYEWRTGENLFFCREGWLPVNADMNRIHRISSRL